METTTETKTKIGLQTKVTTLLAYTIIVAAMCAGVAIMLSAK